MPQVTVDFPSGGFSKGLFPPNMGLEANKIVRHQSVDRELFGPAVTVAALTTDVHIVKGTTATVVGLEAAICGTIATGADRTVTIDLHKSTGAGAFATVLSSTIGFTDASVLRTAVAAVINATTGALVDGDILRIIVTVAGSAGNQALGLVVTMTMEETYA